MLCNDKDDSSSRLERLEQDAYVLSRSLIGERDLRGRLNGIIPHTVIIHRSPSRERVFVRKFDLGSLSYRERNHFRKSEALCFIDRSPLALCYCT